jgi:hypothetical protein
VLLVGLLGTLSVSEILRQRDTARTDYIAAATLNAIVKGKGVKFWKVVGLGLSE